MIGFILGLAKIIPGMSGSVLAMSFNVYEKAIKSFNNLKELKNLIYLTKLGFGIIVSIVFGSNIIIYFIQKYELETTFLFVGLILGSKEELSRNIKSKYYYLTLISFLLIIFFLCFKNIAIFSYSNNIFMYFVSGIIESISSIIPGISGTSLLIMMGTYENVISIFSNLINIKYVFANFLIILPFTFGIIFGLILALKIVNYLFLYYYYQTYNIILGFLYGSIFVMLINVEYDFLNFMISILFFILGFITIKKVNHFF